MSLYEQSENKLKELDDVISKAKDTNSTLNVSAIGIGDALTKFTQLNESIFSTTQKIEVHQAKIDDLYLELIESLNKTVANIGDENRALIEEVNCAHQKYLDFQNGQLTKFEQNIIDKQSMQFNQHKDFITQANQYTNEKLALFELSQKESSSRTRKSQRMTLITCLAILLITATGLASTLHLIDIESLMLIIR